MQCQIFDPEQGFIRCEFWDMCQTSAVCACEVERREANGIPPPNPSPVKLMIWPRRREQILGFVEERGDISVKFLVEELGAAYNTACHWVKRLRDEGRLKKISRTIRSGPNAGPATYISV